MKSLSKEKNNIGGIARLYVTPAENLTEIQSTAVPGVFSITLSSTEDVYDLTAIAETVRGFQEMKYSAAGLYYEHLVQATLAKDTPELQLVLQELAGRRLILILRDHNDRYRLIGSTTEAVRISHKTSSGAKIADLQAADLSFEGRTTRPSVFIQNPI